MISNEWRGDGLFIYDGINIVMVINSLIKAVSILYLRMRGYIRVILFDSITVYIIKIYFKKNERKDIILMGFSTAVIPIDAIRLAVCGWPILKDI